MLQLDDPAPLHYFFQSDITPENSNKHFVESYPSYIK